MVLKVASEDVHYGHKGSLRLLSTIGLQLIVWRSLYCAEGEQLAVEATCKRVLHAVRGHLVSIIHDFWLSWSARNHQSHCFRALLGNSFCTLSICHTESRVWMFGDLSENSRSARICLSVRHAQEGHELKRSL